MQNLWDCIDYCCRSILKNKKLLLTSEERDEILADWAVNAFIRFRQRVLNGNYDRSYALWQNVFYCCWGTWSSVWRPAKRQIINKINTTSLDNQMQVMSEHSSDAGSAMVDMMPQDLSTQLNYKHDYNDCHARHELLNIPDQRDAAYELYVEDCYDLGIEPVDLETFVVRNGGIKEWADPKRTYKDYTNELKRKYKNNTKLEREIHAEERKAADLIKARYQRSSSSASNSSGSTGSPLME